MLTYTKEEPLSWSCCTSGKHLTTLCAALSVFQSLSNQPVVALPSCFTLDPRGHNNDNNECTCSLRAIDPLQWALPPAAGDH